MDAEGIRRRGVVVSIASVVLSTFGSTLSIFTYLLDLCLGHDAVAQLLILMSGQETRTGSHSPKPRQAHPRSHQSPPRGRQLHRHNHHNHHEHQAHGGTKSGILVKSHPLQAQPGQPVHGQASPAVPRPPLPIRSQTQIPMITIHTPEQHALPFSSSPSNAGTSPAHLTNLGRKIERPPLLIPVTGAAAHRAAAWNQHDQHASVTSSLAHSRPHRHVVDHAYQSDSEIHSPALQERTTSITFAPNLPLRPPKDQRSPSSQKLTLPPLGTSPAHYRQGHHRTLSRCSSSPNLSTPPATPAALYMQNSPSNTSLQIPCVVKTVRRRRQSAGEADPAPAASGSTADNGSSTSVQPPGSQDKKPDLPKSKSIGNLLRRVPSAPGPLMPDTQKLEQTTRKAFAFGFAANGTPKQREKEKEKGKEKAVKPKRSQTALTTSTTNSKSKPRTQPYEAPFFCPTPDSVPRVRRQTPSKSDPNSRAQSPAPERTATLH